MSMLAIFQCIASNDLDTMKYYLKNNEIDINKTISPVETNDSQFHHLTPLFYAAKQNNIKAIQMLLESGADVKKVISEHNGLFASAYDYAILTQNEAMTELFNQYASDRSMVSTRSKTRSKNTPVFDFASTKGKRGRKPKSSPALGKVQNF